MMKQTVQNQPQKSRRQRGQSLVEIALFFPIFIIMLAGLVEVANLLVTQNRVTSASRASTRFAANGGEDEGMTTTLLNAVTQTLQLEEEVWDVWAVRGRVNEDGDDIVDESWEFNHIYGISNTVNAGAVVPDNIRAQVLQQLRTDENGVVNNDYAKEVRFVATYAIHDVDSILGLDALPQLQGFTSVQELTVMRVIGFNLENTDGCNAFPIAVNEGIRSVTPPGTGSNPYPNVNAFGYPDPGPEYIYFINHNPDTPLLSATEGDVFKLQNGFGDGNFGWLRWNEYILDTDTTLANSLTWPGDSANYVTVGTGTTPPGFDHPVLGFIESGDPSDTTIHDGDWIKVNSASPNTNGVRSILQDHIDTERALRLIVWDTSDSGNGRYLTSGFAVFRMVGYNMDQSWILLEFIRWDESCGQVN